MGAATGIVVGRDATVHIQPMPAEAARRNFAVATQLTAKMDAANHVNGLEQTSLAVDRGQWSEALGLAGTAAAAATRRLRLGTGICLIIQRDPIVTAKEVASLDFLSGGRFEFGVGAGWNQDEIENHGTEFRSRYRLMKERVLAMKAIWTRDAAAFHGEFVRFDRLWSYPKPVQQPHPPVLLGGEGQHTLRRVVEFCDGWFPRARAGVDAILAQTKDLRAHAERVGRDPKTISTSVFGGKADPAVFERYRAAGIDRVVLPLPSEGRDRVLPLLDQHAALLR